MLVKEPSCLCAIFLKRCRQAFLDHLIDRKMLHHLQEELKSLQGVVDELENAETGLETGLDTEQN